MAPHSRNHLALRALALAALTVSAGCGDDGDSTPAEDTGVDAADAADGSGDPADVAEDTVADTLADTEVVESDTVTDVTPDDGSGDTTVDPHLTDCDPLDEFECALPWPSNLYLEPDDSRETGFTLAFGETTLPSNFRRVPISPEPYRRLDGYSISTPLITQWPNLDVSALATDRNIAPSLTPDAQVVWFEDTGDGLERVPYFAEIDAWEEDPALQVLWVRPAVILEEGTRYVVAFRNLTNTDGTTYEPSPAFAALRDGTAESDALLAPRIERFEQVFADLEDEGIDRDSLQLAWDFNTASSDSLHSRMLHMRDEALDAQPSGPEIVVTSGWERTFSTLENPYWAHVLRGYIEVPDYMAPDVIEDPSGNITGYLFNIGDDGLPEPYGTRQAEFWIGIPHSAMDGTPHQLMQYGHGFFGLADEVTGSWTANGRIANEHHYIYYGGNWTGMAEQDYGNAQFFIFNLNHFPWLPDRSHQGMLEFILFARAMKERFGQLPEVIANRIDVDTDDMAYMGISQGGIYGATYMALAPDIARGHLGVPGQNYSLLEHRSTNFDDFFVAMNGAYRGRARQAVLLSALQCLWDTIDPSSYYRHISAEPFGDDTAHSVLLAPSKGDRQVTNLSIEVVARSNVGVAVMENYDDEREVPLTTETPYPHTGSGIVLYDFGPEWAPEAYNKPPGDFPIDVHEAPRFNDWHNDQLAHFLKTGEIIDVCGGDGCTPSCEPGQCRVTQTAP